MVAQLLSQNEYLQGTHRKGIHAESGVAYSCFTPPTINDRLLLLPARISQLADKAEKLLANLTIRPASTPMILADFQSSVAEKRGGKQEIRNYDAAKRILVALSKEPLTVNLACEANRILLHNARGKDKTPGVLRKRISIVLDIDTLEVSYVPPHYLELPWLLDDLEHFWSNSALSTSKLVHIAIAQYQFVAIHPFNDGNGRVSRLISEVLLWKYGLVADPSINLHSYFENNRRRYHAALGNATRMEGSKNIYDWIEFFLEGIITIATQKMKTP